jgi:hypothetical protein
VITFLNDTIGGNIDTTEICIIGDTLLNDMSLSTKLNGLGIKIDHENMFDIFRYGFTVLNLKHILFEIPLNRLTMYHDNMDPYFIHDSQIIMKDAILKDMPTFKRK